MGWACSNMGRGELYTGFGWGNLKEGDHFEDLCADEVTILRWIFRKWDGGLDWTYLAQDRDSWPVFVLAVMNRMFP